MFGNFFDVFRSIWRKAVRPPILNMCLKDFILVYRFSDDLLMDFRSNFTTPSQCVGQSEHAKTLRLPSDLKDLHGRCVNAFFVCSLIFDAERL